MESLVYCLPCGETVDEKIYKEALLSSNNEKRALFIMPSKKHIDKIRKETSFDVGDFDYLIKEILRLAGEYVSEISEKSKEILVLSLLKSLASSSHLEHFSGFSQSRGLVSAIVNFIEELSLAGISADDFIEGMKALNETGTIRAKDREFLTIFKAYESLLEAGALLDKAMLF